MVKEIVSLLSLQLIYSYLNELTLYAGVIYMQPSWYSFSSWPHIDITTLGHSITYTFLASPFFEQRCFWDRILLYQQRLQFTSFNSTAYHASKESPWISLSNADHINGNVTIAKIIHYWMTTLGCTHKYFWLNLQVIHINEICLTFIQKKCLIKFWP